jgi:hypothetical protein
MIIRVSARRFDPPAAPNIGRCSVLNRLKKKALTTFLASLTVISSLGGGASCAN